jgi:hypothetical protein
VATAGASADARGGGGRRGQASGADAKPARTALAEGRLGQTPVDLDTLEGSFLSKVVRVPGGMQVVMATVLVVVLTVMGSVMATIPDEGAEPGSVATRTVFEAYGASALLFLLPPLILVGNALFFSLHVKRRRMWTVSAIMLGIFSLLLPQFLFPAGFLGYAALRSKRIEDGPRRRIPPRADDADDADEDEARSTSDEREEGADRSGGSTGEDGQEGVEGAVDADAATPRVDDEEFGERR